MIDTYGHAIVEKFCGEAKKGEEVDLQCKLWVRKELRTYN